MSGGLAKALDGTDFAALMQRLGPFGESPTLAVAVSGGADSLALSLLLQEWAAARGGSVVGLTVDHGLRAGSAAEARRVGRQLRSLGLRHYVLDWREEHRGGSLQTAAREARYALLEAWCRRRGVLFLALGHHLDDQAETFLLRLARGSGLDGLAAMTAASETRHVRLIRPLLTVPKARLEATLRDRGVSWIEDPSNFDRAHARVRMRELAPNLAGEGMTARRLFDATRHLGRARCALEREVAELLSRTVSPHPAGFARLDAAPLARASEEVALRALGRLVATIGGNDYAPRMARLTRLYDRILAGLGRGATLGGCRIVGLRDGRLLVAREAARVQDMALQPGQAEHWDGRFEIALRSEAAAAAPWRVAALGCPAACRYGADRGACS